MKYCECIGISMALLLPLAVNAGAQSLADMARAEHARRQSIKTPAKVYTNESLRDEPAPPALPPSPKTSVDHPSLGDGDQVRMSEPPKDERYWRQRVDAERVALARAEIVVNALQSHVNALTNDFAARDDPAQRSVIGAERQNAVGELERMRQQLLAHRKAIADIQEEARRAGIPAGWVR